MPKKIQLAPSQARWQLAAANSVLVLVGLHHLRMLAGNRDSDLMNNLIRIISSKGILLAVAEQLDMDALEIDPDVDLKHYGLDSVAITNLVGIWRTHGAELRYEDVLRQASLYELARFVLQSLPR
jgi:aryl carrier-like protein